MTALDRMSTVSAPIFILWLKGALILGIASKRSCYTSMSNWTHRAWSSTGNVKFWESLILKLQIDLIHVLKKPIESDRDSMVKKQMKNIA